MQVISGHQNAAVTLGRALRRPVIAIGNFDGVHRGHQALLAQARALADGQQGEAGVLTFAPHPARFFSPLKAPPMIDTLDRRLELFAAAGMNFAVIEPFTAALASLSPDAFVHDLLAGGLGVRHVVVGYDFTFGRGRTGNATTLTSLGAETGLGVTVVPAVSEQGVLCSSSNVRALVQEGHVHQAAALLGRPFELSGPVVRGAARGRTIGYPTANLAVEGELLPRAGIYAAVAHILDGPLAGGAHRAAVSVGTNPTFVDGQGLSVEAYLLDFAADLYAWRLRLDIIERIRDERRFESVAALVEQIADDVLRTRALILDPAGVQ